MLLVGERHGLRNHGLRNHGLRKHGLIYCLGLKMIKKRKKQLISEKIMVLICDDVCGVMMMFTE